MKAGKLTLCFLDERIVLSARRKAAAVDEETYFCPIFSSGRADGAINAARENAARFIKKNGLRKAKANVLIKHPATLARVDFLPALSKSEFASYIALNEKRVFPVSVDGFITGYSVIHKAQNETDVYFAAVPQAAAEAVTGFISDLKIQVNRVCLLQELLTRVGALRGEDCIVLIDNGAKINMAFLKNGRVSALRDMAFSPESFAGDFKRALSMYEINDAASLFFFGERLAGLIPGLNHKGAAFGTDYALSAVKDALFTENAADFRPQAYKTRSDVIRAFKKSCMTAVLFLSFLSAAGILAAVVKGCYTVRIDVLRRDDAILEGLLANAALLAGAEAQRAVFDVYLDFFYCYNSYITDAGFLEKAAVKAEQKAVVSSGYAKSGRELTEFARGLAEKGGFSSVELTKLSASDDGYYFEIVARY